MTTETAKHPDRLWSTLSPAKQAEYGTGYLDAFRAMSHKFNVQNAWPAEKVITTMEHAATAVNPRWRYVVGMDAIFIMVPLMAFPMRVAEWISLHGTNAFSLKPAAANLANANYARKIPSPRDEEVSYSQ